MCVCTNECSSCRGPKRAPSALYLELQGLSDPMWVLAIEWILLEEQQVVLATEASLALRWVLLTSDKRTSLYPILF